MSFKSFLNKIIKKKAPEADESEKKETDKGPFDISAENLEKAKSDKNNAPFDIGLDNIEIDVEQDPISPDIITEKEEDIIFGEIDIYVRDEKFTTKKISKQEITIGRDPAKANLIILEPIISKLHCTVFAKEGKIFIKDNDSTNGTYLVRNGAIITEQEVKEKDIISLGKTGIVKLIIKKTNNKENNI
jgi:pSer/pThr/pTyr-binding forkhead associated (FHA) protein